ncbi:hypothetical protein [Actinocatenispora rupis]|uniref:Uncharacterized protein n=1 Tax=Actinocatenispora rupis TaxID=519421 RepID=A0A8J3NE31_9ACTN|nr:hypothetical protein [Actinocatenispora rupis]GID15621.1 hypothetical protein Aru02nite_65100 [Actinocatenispora rupis]
MTAKQTKTASSHRSIRMAPAVPRSRGGATPSSPTPYESRRALEFSAGGYIWR